MSRGEKKPRNKSPLISCCYGGRFWNNCSRRPRQNTCFSSCRQMDFTRATRPWKLGTFWSTIQCCRSVDFFVCSRAVGCVFGLRQEQDEGVQQSGRFFKISVFLRWVAHSNDSLCRRTHTLKQRNEYHCCPRVELEIHGLRRSIHRGIYTCWPTQLRPTCEVKPIDSLQILIFIKKLHLPLSLQLWKQLTPFSAAAARRPSGIRTCAYPFTGVLLGFTKLKRADEKAVPPSREERCALLKQPAMLLI